MKLDNKSISLNIPTFTIIKIIIVFLILYLLFLIKDILAVLFISLIIASAVDPIVDFLQKKRISRGISIVMIYSISFFVIFLVITLIIPPIIKETNELLVNSPQYFEKIFSGISVLKEYSAEHGFLDNVKENINTISAGLQTAVGGIFSTIFNFFGGIFSFFLILVITFYMVVEENAVKKLIWSIAPGRYQDYIMGLVNRMQRKIGLWLRGQMVLSLSIFVLTYIFLSLIGFIPGLPSMEYVLVLALIAGLTEFVPYLGPMMGAIPAVFLAFTQSPMLAVAVTILYYCIQLIENNYLVPKIMQKAVGLNPIVSISVLMVGFQLAGVIGAILSIPVATAVQEIILDIFEYKEKGKLKKNDIG